MTTQTAPLRASLSGKAELGVAVLLFVLGGVAMYDASTLATNAATRGPLNSSTMPTVVGALLVVLGIALTIDVLRGGRGDMEGGEDIDLDDPTAWVPFVAIGGVFLGQRGTDGDARVGPSPGPCCSGVPSSHSAVGTTFATW